MAKMLKSKYNSTGERCVDACLNYGELRYVADDGSPIKIEIPCDKYEEAIYDFMERVKDGLTHIVMEPRDVLKRGTITYNQAKSIAIEGKVRGIEIYDIDESIECEHMLGISGSIEYALSIWNGDSEDEALKKAIIRAIKVYGDDFIKELRLEESPNVDEYKEFCKAVCSTNKINNIELFRHKHIYIDDEVYDRDSDSKQKVRKNINLSLGIVGTVFAFTLMRILTDSGENIVQSLIYVSIILITMVILAIIFIRCTKLIGEKCIKINTQPIVDIFNEELEKVTYDNLLAEKECKTILKNITKGEISTLLANMKGSVNKKLSCNAVVTKETKYMLESRRTVVLPGESDVQIVFEKLVRQYRKEKE